MMDMLLVALRANQIIKAATQTLTKTELEQGLSKALPMVIAMDHSPDQTTDPVSADPDATASDH
jgi:hypothetical protein